MTEIQKKLYNMQDSKYKAFNSRLIPDVPVEKQIGVRIPDIRRLAKELKNTDKAHEFLNSLPHEYFEENNLHAYLLETIRDFDTAIEMTEKFLPFIDNWATCDTMSMKVFSQNIPALYEKIRVWLKSDDTYTIRFGVNMLMKFFLDENFSEEVLKLVAEIRNKEYYVNMARAWFFQTAMTKQREATLPYLTGRKLDKWTHNKTIQKCRESFRISDSDKELLKEMKL